MSRPMNVAVIGSCATRDNFYSKFNPSYREFFNCTVTQNQSSIISLASNPIEVDNKMIDNFEEQNKFRDVRSDLSKEVYTQLYKKKPDMVIFDFFADIHFGVIKLADDQYITNNRWKLQKTKYFQTIKDRPNFSINADRKKYMELWERSFDSIMEYIKLINPNCMVYIHRARNAKYMIDIATKEQTLLAESNKMLSIDVDYYNETWAMMDDYAIIKHKLTGIDIFTDEVKCPSDHPWGAFYVHYTMDYYEKFLNDLIKLTDRKSFIKRLFS